MVWARKRSSSFGIRSCPTPTVVTDELAILALVIGHLDQAAMLATAKAIAASSIRAARPTISEADLRAAVFERLYASDYSPEQLASISERIRTTWNGRR